MEKVLEKGMEKIGEKFVQNISRCRSGKINFDSYWCEPYVKLIIINGTENDIKLIRFIMNDDESKETMNSIDPNFLNKKLTIPANSYKEITVGEYFRTFHDGVGDSKKASFRMEYVIVDKNSEKDSFVDGIIVFPVKGS